MKIKSIWRYPIKSMGGESLTQSPLSHHGVVGDRNYALHDGKSICSAKKYAQLMGYSARYDDEPDGINTPNVTVEIGSTVVSSKDSNLEELLSRELGTKITLDTLRPKDNLEYYRRSGEHQPVEEIRSILGLEEGEAFPDFSEFPDSSFEFSTPPGTFFDAYPLLVLTTNSLNRLQQATEGADIDERRFRPNLVIDADELEAGFIEEQWRDRLLEIGDAIIKLTLPCPRCVMTTIAFQDLGKAPQIMRSLVQENHHKLGIYGQVIKPGKIQTGDQVHLSEAV
ncbi:MAG: MOSC domain-containing protein [Gammaproteobacteria bacterium]|nr:MOSC domain-containing protein [Gammaproteobacteria bacterium]